MLDLYVSKAVTCVFMRSIITLITSLILLIPASGQGQWEKVNVAIQTTCVPPPGPSGPPSVYNLYDVQFTDRDNGFFTAVGVGFHFSVGLLYKTEDGGNKWNRIFEKEQTDFSSVHFINESKGFIISNGLLASSDGGASWAENSSLDIRVGAFYFLNDSTFWVAQKWNIYKTVNGGIGWNREYSNPDGTYFNSLYFMDDLTGWGVGEEGLISKYSLIDGWINISAGKDLPIRKVFFVDRDNGWISGGYSSSDDFKPIFLRTVDGGEIWTKTRRLNYLINDFYFINKDHGWAVGEYCGQKIDLVQYDDLGVILETFNGGRNWNVLFDNLPARLNAIHIADGVGWAVGDDGLILKCDSVATGIKEDNKVYGQNEPLFQNYPNPFRSGTIITYQLITSSNVELSIFDISGRKVVTLVKERQQPDSHEVKWNAEGMNPGIYFCELKTGNGRQVIKMSLVK